MAISVRMDPLLEKELEASARKLGVTKSQFIIDAVERALGKKNPYDLMVTMKTEETRAGYALRKAFKGTERSYETAPSRDALRAKLTAKHLAGGTD